jgi:hypothetical protein
MAYQVSTGRFVGRTQELARLSQLLAYAADGTPLVAVIGGEAGVGKTWLAAIAGGQSVGVLRGGYVPLDEDGLPLVPVTDHCAACRPAGRAELDAVAGPAREELGRLLPDLAWSGQAAAGAAVAGAGQGWLFERLLGVVQQLAATAPLLLIVEDLHWADRSTATCSPRRPTGCPGRRPGQGGTYPRRKPDAGLAGQRLRRSGGVRISSYFRSL